MFRKYGWLLSLIVTLTVTGSALAQDNQPYTPYAIEDLQQLVAPVALYPDALLAQVFVACTYPNDVMAAAQYESQGGDPQGIDSQPWDDSVKGVARYPSLIQYMASNPDWMNSLGAAFLNQQSDVFTAVQNLRAEAVANGNLVSTPQQTVINQDGIIQIIPTDPNTLYLPVYDPNVAFAAPQYNPGDVYTPCVTFSQGVPVGDWFDFDFDWYDHDVYHGHWGKDRPWWHRDSNGQFPRYVDNRPGRFSPLQRNDAGGHPVNVQAGRWTRNDQKPAPRPVRRPAPPPPTGRPERGYQPPAPPVNNPPGYGRGTDVGRNSNRGQQSRTPPQPQRPAPPPPAPRPEPQRPEPPHQEAPPPPPPAREPPQGGAMGGNQGNSQAGQSSARGAGSRRH